MFITALDVSLRIVAAAAAVGLVLVVFRVRSGAARHAAWTAVLVAMLMMPVLIAIVPKVEVPVPSALALDLSGIDYDVTPYGASPVEEASRVSSAPVSTTAATGTEPAASRPVRWFGQLPGWTSLLAALYLAGLVLFAARLVGGWRLAQRLVAGATPVEVTNSSCVLESPAVATPLTAGVVAPSIVLPVTWRAWPDDKLAAVLAHENAHIVRRDALVAFLAQVNLAIFWFHPLAWWLERTLAVSAEHACDEAAARQIGQPRRYAEVLLDMAEAVSKGGQRVSWQTIGVDGSGLLGARIDRILKGDTMTRMSGAKRAGVALGCASVLILAIACRQQIQAEPLRPDPKVAERLAAEPVRTKRFEASRDMTPAEADVLEERIAKNPEDWDARERLVTYYNGGRAVPWDKKVPGLRRHALWLIEHHPEHDVRPPALSPEYDPLGFAEAVRLWNVQLAKPDVSPFLIHRAAQFFAPYDKPRAEGLILRGLAMDPDSKRLAARMPENVAGYAWPSQLGSLYGAALMGSSNLSIRKINRDEMHSPYAMEVRRKLEASHDAALLARVGSYVTSPLGRPEMNEELKELGRGYLERAVTLQPDLTTARASLVRLQMIERHNRIYEAKKKGTPVSDFDLLPYEAQEALTEIGRAQSASDYGKDEAAAKAAREKALTHAREALRLADERRQDPAYSWSIVTVHLALAELALHEGDRDKATDHLMAATKVPASEEIKYTPAAAGWLRTVNYLLKAGERERVIRFLEAYAQISVVERDRLLEDAKAIREGRMPTAYQYMVAREG